MAPKHPLLLVPRKHVVRQHVVCMFARARVGSPSAITSLIRARTAQPRRHRRTFEAWLLLVPAALVAVSQRGVWRGAATNHHHVWPPVHACDQEGQEHVMGKVQVQAASHSRGHGCRRAPERGPKKSSNMAVAPTSSPSSSPANLLAPTAQHSVAAFVARETPHQELPRSNMPQASLAVPCVVLAFLPFLPCWPDA